MRFAGLDPSLPGYVDMEVALNLLVQALGGAVSTGNATVTQVASDNSSKTLLAANSTRVGFKIFNDSTAVLYILFGSGSASSSNYSIKLNPQQLHEDKGQGTYRGQINGIWAAINGNAYTTEW